MALASATVVAALFDTASATLAPAVTSGQSIPLDTEDWVLKLQFNAATTIRGEV